jgi:hypothetical protein
MSAQNVLSFTMSTLLILLSGAIYLWTSGMTPGAELFPRIMAGGLALFGIVDLSLLVGKIRGKAKKYQKPQLADPLLVRKSIIFMGAFFLLIIVFFGVLPFVGFPIASSIFMFVSMLLIGGRKALRKWPVALIVPAVLILVFKYGLDVRLPSLSIF